MEFPKDCIHCEYLTSYDLSIDDLMFACQKLRITFNYADNINMPMINCDLMNNKSDILFKER